MVFLSHLTNKLLREDGSGDHIHSAKRSSPLKGDWGYEDRRQTRLRSLRFTRS